MNTPSNSPASLLWQTLKHYFNALPEKVSEEETIEQIKNGISFRGGNLWILVFAIFMASLGLNVNSTAVIIGAMLISPLMGPIIGMGLSIGITDFELFRRSLRNYIVATVISVLTATTYFLITPLNEAQSELLARTSPTLYDVLIALFGGAAGIIALSTRGKSNVIPGVAIATALMPPLCTAGYGLAHGQLSYFLGAFYLFFINTVFIGVATVFGVRLLHFHRKQFINPKRAKRVQSYITTIVLATMLPAFYLTYTIVNQSFTESNMKRFVRETLASEGTQILSSQIDTQQKSIRVVALGKEISKQQMEKAENLLPQYKLAQYSLNIIQGERSDSLLNIGLIKPTFEAQQEKMVAQNAELSQLKQALSGYTQYKAISTEVGSEIGVLFPQVSDVSIARIDISPVDSATKVRQQVVSIISLRPTSQLTTEQRNQLQAWLQRRCNADSIQLLITPQ
jgi:uncharacterized hydrophobic protein (TIGR00271 family)